MKQNTDFVRKKLVTVVLARFSYEVYGPDVNLNDMEEETRKIALQMLKHSFSNKGWQISERSSERTVRDFMEGECRVCTATVAFRKN